MSPRTDPICHAAAESAAACHTRPSLFMRICRPLPLRKLVVPTLSVLLAGSGFAAAQEKNPFAEWDRLQRRTNASLDEPEPTSIRPPARSTRSVDYFSPGGATTPAPSDSQDSAAAYRERMNVTGRSGSPSDAPTSGRPAEPPATGETRTADWPQSFTVRGSGEASGSGSPTPLAPPSTINHAEFERTGNDPFAEIRRVADEASAPPAAPNKEPSLDEFLRRYGSPNGARLSNAEGPIPQLTLPPSARRNASPPGTEPGAEPVADAIAEPTAESGAEPFVDPAASAAQAAQAVASPPRTDNGADTAPGPQSPGVTLSWNPQGDLNVGREAVLELLIHNTSPSLVRDVAVEALIPESLQIVSSSPQPLSGTAAPTWTFGALQPGEERTVSVTAIPRQRGDLRLGAVVRLSGSASTAFSVQEPLLGVALEGPTEGAVGEQLRYNIRVSNPGTGVARDVVVQAALPEGLEHRHGSLITMDVGTLNPGESQLVQLALNAIGGGDQRLNVRAVADGGLTDQTESTIAVAQPELDLLIDGPQELLAGRSGDYEVMVVNRGAVPSANVRARYRVPEGYEFVSADRGGRFDDAERSVEFFVGTLQPGESSNLRLTLKATQSGTHVHQAGVISEHGQVTMARRETAVQGVAELKLDVSGSGSTVNTGATSTFDVTISNASSRAATGVGLSCELPPGLELIDAVGPAEYIAENGVIVFRSVPEIAAGDAVSIRIRTRARRVGTQSLRLRVASDSISEPLIGEAACRVVR